MKTILRPSGERSFTQDAIRDVIIVVVGILAALWLESAWQDFNDRKTERQILTSLRIEFEKNQEELDGMIASWNQGLINQTEIHELMGGAVNEETVAQFDVLRSRSNSGRAKLLFDPRHGQLTSVINSGQLGLVRNSDLRALIADWPALVADLDFERELLLGNVIHGSGLTNREHGRSWPDSRFESRSAELMRNRLYDNQLAVLAGIFRRMISESEVIKDATDDIIALIDSQLANQ
jgi:hypothetical protein